MNGLIFKELAFEVLGVLAGRKVTYAYAEGQFAIAFQEPVTHEGALVLCEELQRYEAEHRYQRDVNAKVSDQPSEPDEPQVGASQALETPEEHVVDASRLDLARHQQVSHEETEQLIAPPTPLTYAQQDLLRIAQQVEAAKAMLAQPVPQSVETNNEAFQAQEVQASAKPRKQRAPSRRVSKRIENPEDLFVANPPPMPPPQPAPVQPVPVQPPPVQPVPVQPPPPVSMSAVMQPASSVAQPSVMQPLAAQQAVAVPQSYPQPARQVVPQEQPPASQVKSRLPEPTPEMTRGVPIVTDYDDAPPPPPPRGRPLNLGPQGAQPSQPSWAQVAEISARAQAHAPPPPPPTRAPMPAPIGRIEAPQPAPYEPRGPNPPPPPRSNMRPSPEGSKEAGPVTKGPFDKSMHPLDHGDASRTGKVAAEALKDDSDRFVARACTEEEEARAQVINPAEYAEARAAQVQQLAGSADVPSYVTREDASNLTPYERSIRALHEKRAQKKPSQDALLLQPQDLIGIDDASPVILPLLAADPPTQPGLKNLLDAPEVIATLPFSPEEEPPIPASATVTKIHKLAMLPVYANAPNPSPGGPWMQFLPKAKAIDPDWKQVNGENSKYAVYFQTNESFKTVCNQQAANYYLWMASLPSPPVRPFSLRVFSERDEFMPTTSIYVAITRLVDLGYNTHQISFIVRCVTGRWPFEREGLTREQGAQYVERIRLMRLRDNWSVNELRTKGFIDQNGNHDPELRAAYGDDE